ncbi:AAA family ATPase [Nesterenkonia flava]|uniref:AAA family ATPase n=1 Tax=Nesterenkonia flava TaxID=469799 RepID=A0ABU1FQV8_9MICC|nr:AAA family ATPase [Nesterenkonia flava]MDR5711040.1 AAA family ATPase [Nesterenkonia flava]
MSMHYCSVVTTGQLARDHVAALESLHSRVTVDRRCEDLAELVAVAAAIRADAALIVGGTEALADTLLSELRGRGTHVVIVSDVAAERARLSRLGAVCFDDDVDPARLARALEEGRDIPGPPMVAEGVELSSFPSPVVQDWPSTPTAEASAPEAYVISGTDSAPPQGPEDITEAETSGESVPLQGLTCVWGSHGSPGRTTVAVNLAAELALSGARVLLIDADTTAAAVAVHLGLLDETAGLAQACRFAEMGTLDHAALARSAITVETAGAAWDVLTGLPRADRWAQLRPRGIERVLKLAAIHYDCVLIDVAASIESEETGFDVLAPQRHGATLSALRSADRTLTVGAADPVSFSRLVKALEEHRERLPDAVTPELIINQVRRTVVGRSPRDQLRQAWEQLQGRGRIGHFLSWDQAACDTALLKGQVLAEAAPQSVLRREIAQLAGIVIPSRRRRLASGGRTGRRSRRISGERASPRTEGKIG